MVCIASPKKHAISKRIRIFAVTFNSQESSKQEKHCDKVPFTEFRQSTYGGMSILLSLGVYAMGTHAYSISSGVKYVSLPQFQQMSLQKYTSKRT